MWLLPTRRRVANLQRFFAAYQTAGGSTPGMVLVDVMDYDDGAAAYDGLKLPLGWSIEYTRGETQGEKIAEVWDQVKDCAWLGLIGDDCVPETPGWDKLLVDRLDGTNFVSCDDGWQAPRRAANCWVISGPLVRAVGYIFPPGLRHLYVDDVWETIGREADCWTRAMQVMVRHRHVLRGDATSDDTHEKVYGVNYPADAHDISRLGGLWPSDTAAFKQWLEDERHIAVDAARKLRPAAPAILPARDDAEALGRERLEYCKTRKVMILTPIAHRPAWQYTAAYGETVRLLEKNGIEWDKRFVVGSSDLPRARDFLSAMFMASGYTDAMMIDDDMNWVDRDILRLLASKQLLIGASGRKKVDRPNTDPSVWCAYFEDAHCDVDEMGAISSTGRTKVGGAFMRARREVFEQMIAAHPDRKRIPDPMTPLSPEIAQYYYRFFRNEEGGEDYYFCDQWTDLGNKVWVDPAITLGHVGEMEWKGALGELMLPHMAA